MPACVPECMHGTIALISHDGCKPEMARLAQDWRNQLSDYSLVGTRGTCAVLETAAGLTAEPVRSGPYGGDVEIASRIYAGEIKLVIFLRDPLSAHPHEADVQALLRACDLESIPIATNRASADLFLTALLSQAAPPLTAVAHLAAA